MPVVLKRKCLTGVLLRPLKRICVFRSGYAPIPHMPRIPRIDKYLDSWLNCTLFVKNLTDSHSPWSVLAICRSIRNNSAQKFWALVATLSSFVGNRELKPSNKAKEEIVEGFSPVTRM